MKFYVIGIITGLYVLTSSTVHAKCDISDKLCIMAEIKETAKSIDNRSWKDISLRELAKSYTHAGHEDRAIALIAEIETPDTKAMTIRGIGMAAADNEWENKERYNKLFENLATEADKIDHKPSHAIAYTYIAMSQAFAKDDAGAMATAKSMENDALRNKAFAETAEIQAERGDFNTAMASIKEIDTASFRNKAYGSVADIFTKQGRLNEAYETAGQIDNAYKKTEALLKIINYSNDEKTPGKVNR